MEFYSSIRTERAIERADVCLLLVDATEEALTVQDLKVAEKAWDAGCGLIIIVNKWDLVEKETMTAPAFEKSIRERVPYMKWVPILFTSAHTGQRVHRVLELITQVQEQRMRRIPTHQVNDVLRALVTRTKPPAYMNHPVKLLYATQVAVAPPTFVVWSNHPEGIPEAYSRYLHNGFREAWGFEGVPLRINFRERGEDED